MWSVTLGEREGRSEVGSEFWCRLDGCNELLVDGLLVLDSRSSWGLLLLVVTEKVTLALLALWCLFTGKVLGVEFLEGEGAWDGDFGRGSDEVSWVDSSQRHSVDLEWTGDEDGVIDLLQGDDSLASETSGKDDADGSWCDRGSELGWLRCLSGLSWQRRIVSWVVFLNCQ